MSADEKYGFRPETEDDLIAYIRKQLDFEEGGEQGYNDSAEALWRVTVAAFNYAAHVVGATGFQASWAGLQFLRMTRRMEHPFGILDGAQLLYPQYDLLEKARTWVAEWTPIVAPKAKELLNEKSEHAAPQVVAHWRKLAELAEAPA